MSEYMSDEERVAALRKWWSENGTSLLLTVVVVLGGVFGWRWYQDWQQQRIEAASSTYQAYLEARARESEESREKDAEEEAALAARLDTEHAGTTYHVFSLFYRAHDAVAAGQYAEAAARLREALEAADDDRLKDIARIRLAKVLLQQGEHEAALAELAEVRGVGFRSLVAELKGDVLASRGDRVKAAEAYQAALEAQGDSAAAGILRAKLADVSAAADG